MPSETNQRVCESTDHPLEHAALSGARIGRLRPVALALVATLVVSGLGCSGREAASSPVRTLIPHRMRLSNLGREEGRAIEQQARRVASLRITEKHATPVVDDVRVFDGLVYAGPASIAQVYFEDSPESEYARRDVRVVLFRSGVDRATGIITLNADRRDVQSFAGPRGGELLVVLCGTSWRSGDGLAVVSWNVQDGAIRELLVVGGEEDADRLGAVVEMGERLTVTIHGIRPEKRAAYRKQFADVSAREAMVFRVGDP